MTIKYSDVFPILATALPDFQPSAEDWIGPAPYFFLGDMVDFVCQRTSSGSFVEKEQLAVLFERLLLEGDQDVHDLVLDALEGLLECVVKDNVAETFGPRTAQLWRSLLSVK